MEKKETKQANVPKGAPGALLAALGAARDPSRERGAGPKAPFWSQKRLLGEFFSALFAAKKESNITHAVNRFQAYFIESKFAFLLHSTWPKYGFP